jgi:hypothetical protein
MSSDPSFYQSLHATRRFTVSFAGAQQKAATGFDDGDGLSTIGNPRERPKAMVCPRSVNSGLCALPASPKKSPACQGARGASYAFAMAALRAPPIRSYHRIYSPQRKTRRA